MANTKTIEVPGDASAAQRLVGWVDARFPLTATWKAHLSEYYAPKNFNVWYYFGSFALLVLVIQIVTGIFLVMHYKPDASLNAAGVPVAFASVEYIMREVPWGWLIRYMHSTGASMFFIVVYLHMVRGLIYGSYRKPRELVWIFGTAIFLCLMAEAFFGYLLPWGQMSFWGAQVIVNLFSAIPFVGPDLSLWIRGDYVVSDATLNRFFSFHVIAIPLVLLGLVAAHIVALHEVGSNNPDGVEIKNNKDENGIPLDGIPFHPYYSVHDVMGVVVFLFIFSAIVFFAPEMGGYFLESNNFLPANPLQTPPHIAPVWYFTAFYSMLRATTDDFTWVMIVAIAVAFVLWYLRARPSIKIAVAGRGRRGGRHGPAAHVRREVLGRRRDGRRGRDAVLPAVARPQPGQVDPLSAGLAQGALRRVLRRVRGALLRRAPRRRRRSRTCCRRSARVYYFGFFLAMPIWTTLGRFKTPPDRVDVPPALTPTAPTSARKSRMKKLLAVLLFLPLLAAAPERATRSTTRRTSANDQAALQSGAKLFVNYCLNCHNASSMRYNRLQDLGLTDDEIKKNLLFTSDKVGDLMRVAMPAKDAKDWFGAVPPDLSVIARAKSSERGSGADYLYTYLRTYYKDDTRPTGWNNLAYPNSAMPHVLWQLQGTRTPVFDDKKDEEGKTGARVRPASTSSRPAR